MVDPRDNVSTVLKHALDGLRQLAPSEQVRDR
jgi:hypothetical protein